MGRNGSGKSSLLAQLVGLRRPAGGRVRVHGVDPAALAPRDAIGRIGLVPQDPTLLLYHDSVAEECTSADHDAGLAPGTTARLLDEVVPGVDPATHPRDLSEGQRLYTWFNCNGCHSMGGGGMGPALMDDVWIYGAEPSTIFLSIAEGRPNGMPAFGDRVPAQQIWQLVTYVRALSSLVRKDVRPSRADTLSVRPAPSLMPPANPIVAAPSR